MLSSSCIDTFVYWTVRINPLTFPGLKSTLLNMVQTGCSLTPYEALYGFRNTGVDIDINSGVAVY